MALLMLMFFCSNGEDHVFSQWSFVKQQWISVNGGSCACAYQPCHVFLYLLLFPSQSQLIDGVSPYNCGNVAIFVRVKHPFRGHFSQNSSRNRTRQQGEPEGEMHLPLLLFLAFRSLRSLAKKFKGFSCFFLLKNPTFFPRFPVGKNEWPQKDPFLDRHIYVCQQKCPNSEMFERMNKLEETLRSLNLIFHKPAIFNDSF